MADPQGLEDLKDNNQKDLSYPFFAFAFSVEILRADAASTPLCGAAFAECDGIELGMDVKTIREGGNNDTQIRLAGPRVYGTLSLKRGMTKNFDLWDWADAAMQNPRLRATVRVVILNSVARGPDARTEMASFTLSDCLPLKIKAPALNAKDGMVAIEELQIAYQSVKYKRPKTGG